MRNARGRQRHLDAAQRSAQRQVVEESQVTDAKHLFRKAAEAGAERQVVARERFAAESIGVVTLGNDYRGQLQSDLRGPFQQHRWLGGGRLGWQQ